METKAEDIWYHGLSRQTTHKVCVYPLQGNSVLDHGLHVLRLLQNKGS